MRKKLQISTMLLVTLLLLMTTSACNKNDDDDSSIIKDGDGNIYQTVTIGNQVWLKENLKTTKYNDGTPITLAESTEEWNQDQSGAYCWYDNNASANKNVYGALYNWYAVSSDKLCPKGYRVPSAGEWEVLADVVGGMNVAGGMLREIGTAHWDAPNADATDAYGFAALGGGSRVAGSGLFIYLKIQGNWWTSSTFGELVAEGMMMNYMQKELFSGGQGMYDGFSVRCIKDFPDDR